MSTLCWLHLSDIHFRPSHEWRDATARAALLEHLDRQIKQHGLKIDLIFCTGDIAFGALRDQPLDAQYALAQDFFENILRICGGASGPLLKDRLFVVPGNHDVDRGLIDRAAQRSWTEWGQDSQARQEQRAIENEFARPSGAAQMALERLNAYAAFTRAFLPHLDAQPQLHYAHTITIDGVKVGIGGFNSAWTCAGDEDDRRLWLGAQFQFNAMRAALDDANLRIGLIHHPHDWFNVAERSLIEERQQRDFDFWLHGHTHDLKVHDHARGVRIGAGAIAADASDEFGYNIVQFDTATAKGCAYLYHYDTDAGAWKNLTLANIAEHGIQSFRLPSAADTPQPPANPPPRHPGLVPRRLPPDGPCLAREAELADLAAALAATPPRPVLIHGYGGSGKTEIASHYLHGDATRQRFGTRRLFVSVEALEGVPADELPARLHDHLDSALFGGALGKHTALADALHTTLTADGRALLILDNFETVVKIAPTHSAELLDSLAPLADAGLALVVTLREPLSRPRSPFASIAPKPFGPDAARRVLLHWMGRATDTPLGDRDEAALAHLLTVADGWPIALQMLGILASIEGLPALARRCPSGAALVGLADELPSRDPHRHLPLSNALTYDAPSLGDPARQLLRVLAGFPAGLPEDWLDHWPDAVAVRQVRQYRLLRDVTGALGEPRHTLLTPLRDYLLQAHPLQADDKPPLTVAARAWWQANAPELFNEALPWQAPADYRDLHRREVGTMAMLRGLSAGPMDTFARLAERVGEVNDWRESCAKLRAQVLANTTLFPSRADAERFAWLLAGSQSVTTATKEAIASQIAVDQLKASQRDAVRDTVASELDVWGWMFGSARLAERIWQHLAEGDVCFQAGDGTLLEQIRQLDDRDARIALLHLSCHPVHAAGRSRPTIEAELKEHLRQDTNSALATWIAAIGCEGEARVAHLRRAVSLAPDFGSAWHDLARALPDTAPERQPVWLTTQRLAAAHLERARQQSVRVNELIYRTLFAAQHGLDEHEAACATLSEWQDSLPDYVTSGERIRLALAGLQVGQIDASALQLCLAATDADADEARTIHQLAASLANTAPLEAGQIFLLGLYPRFHDNTDLATTAGLLACLSQHDTARALAAAAAADPALSPSTANDLGYNLLTRGGTAPASLALGARLATRGFEGEADSVTAETLLCAAFRVPDAMSAPLPLTALARLLTLAEASDDDARQLADLLFDARRFDGCTALAGWLEACDAPLRDSVGGQWLAARLKGDDAPPTPQADKLDAALSQLDTELAAEKAWATQHADAGAALSALVAKLQAKGQLPAGA